MSRYIDAYSLLESLEKQRAGVNDQMFKIGMNTAMQIVKWHRTADVEEVVRCKDCKFRYTQTCFAKHETLDNDFCSCGAKMGGDAK